MEENVKAHLCFFLAKFRFRNWVEFNKEPATIRYASDEMEAPQNHTLGDSSPSWSFK